MLKNISIGFIGAGNMGSAIIKGIFNGKLKFGSIFVYDLDKEKQKALEEEYGTISVSSEQELAEKASLVFLSVKPQQLDEALGRIKDAVCEKNTVLVSICAGINEEYIKARTHENAKVVLVMPNTPLLLGKGATALAKGSSVAEDEFNIVRDIFSSCGKAVVIDKAQMKEIIAVNGSSPAFVYLFAKAFIDYAASSGIAPEAARDLFCQVLNGSAEMLTQSGLSTEALIAQVASKGGTTEAGLSALREGGFEALVRNACEACTKRAYELGN
ncbi:MAG: pyrroline-5-carboxylate reductase [Oscillospiraceae bacterium]|nr:pyrroline-5-carboxylate reductase [Oscillospiraceae bacterium]